MFYLPNNASLSMLVESVDNTYGHLFCPDQYIIEVRNTVGQAPFFAAGGEAAGEWPSSEWLCKTLRYEVGLYGLAPYAGWTNYYNYVIRGNWTYSSGFWRCVSDFSPDAAGPPLAPGYFTKVRIAVKGSTFAGTKLRVAGGVVF